MSIMAVVDNLFFAYMMMLFIRIIGSWFPEYQQHSFFQFISHYTDPYLNFFKRIIPPLGMLDLSPIVAFFCLKIIENTCKKFVYILIA